MTTLILTLYFTDLYWRHVPLNWTCSLASDTQARRRAYKAVGIAIYLLIQTTLLHITSNWTKPNEMTNPSIAL